MQEAVTIGVAADITGVKVPTIRFYEQIGLVASPPRTGGNRRLYDERHLHRLKFIRHSRELGFDMKDIRALLKLQDRPSEPCAEADAIVVAKLADVRHRMASLRSLEAELERMARCDHERVENCPVINTLADHSLCQHHDGTLSLDVPGH
ncbi:MerR family transcriptional regulator [Mesorhizobium hawassense]|uniref:MerR family transcriptional regulator n=1 Tax=Mesorhizobium hawassense TaxID=1209954 RepID=A0A330HXU4_9HYPH|nr:helix-turn-helix domain-containing protein [Mesorhizobium hawassense]RAZ91509.1 MerR family transcriptional regulator [Mesorhizobium hawassense]